MEKKHIDQKDYFFKSAEIFIGKNFFVLIVGKIFFHKYNLK